MSKTKSKKKTVEVEALTHKEAKRRNIPTAEFESLMRPIELTLLVGSHAQAFRLAGQQGGHERDRRRLTRLPPPLPAAAASELTQHRLAAAQSLVRGGAAA
jgi:hypothetical protein